MSRSESIVNIGESSGSESMFSTQQSKLEKEDEVEGEEVGDGFGVPEDEAMQDEQRRKLASPESGLHPTLHRESHLRKGHLRKGNALRLPPRCLLTQRKRTEMHHHASRPTPTTHLFLHLAHAAATHANSPLLPAAAFMSTQNVVRIEANLASSLSRRFLHTRGSLHPKLREVLWTGCSSSREELPSGHKRTKRGLGGS